MSRIRFTAVLLLQALSGALVIFGTYVISDAPSYPVEAWRLALTDLQFVYGSAMAMVGMLGLFGAVLAM